jgi:sulfatase maturation enzyme AslB (radical SAM superfamily)
LPKLTKVCYINFFGGEPLLSFELIKNTVSFLNKENKSHTKIINYSITTNGSLITEEIINFFNENKFSVVLSFDGLAQDITKEKGSSKRIAKVIRKLVSCPEIHFETNSVFTPETIDLLSGSMKLIIDLGVRNSNFSLLSLDPWNKCALDKLENELRKLRIILLDVYKKEGTIPVRNFITRHGKGLFCCAAGKDRLTITPGGEIWGCYMFPDYFSRREDNPEFQEYCFGPLDRFIESHKKIYPMVLSNYAALSMDNFSTDSMPCLFCSELEDCVVCPIVASFSGGSIGKIPNHICEMRKIKNSQIRKFKENISRLNQYS